jgi:transposase-like protein
VTTLTINVFNVTRRCPVCGGSANARYHAPELATEAHMKHKCGDCGYTWIEESQARSL